ncbi:unnamed protein product, partial [Phaeothamnion confervicola]
MAGKYFVCRFCDVDLSAKAAALRVRHVKRCAAGLGIVGAAAVAAILGAEPSLPYGVPGGCASPSSPAVICLDEDGGEDGGGRNERGGGGGRSGGGGSGSNGDGGGDSDDGGRTSGSGGGNGGAHSSASDGGRQKTVNDFFPAQPRSVVDILMKAQRRAQREENAPPSSAPVPRGISARSSGA